MKQTIFLKFNGKINRRSSAEEVDYVSGDVRYRENFLSRDKKLTTVPGTEKAIDTVVTAVPAWMGRYYTVETGVYNPKTFVYSQDGKLWRLHEGSKTRTVVNEELEKNAYPKHVLWKTGTQIIMYLVDGKNLWKHDGNNSDSWERISVLDSDGNSVLPIDVIVHKDRLILISLTKMFISKNLAPETFDDSTDSLEIVIGSGRGKNMQLGKIEDNLFIFTTEGIYALIGDTISALAATFDIRLVDDRKIIAGRSAVKVENAIVFLGDDLELWSFDGNSTKMLSYLEVLKDLIFSARNMLDKATAIYENNYYKLSVVKNGETMPNFEVWWDALEDKIDFVYGRNVSCYLQVDSTQEDRFEMFGNGSTCYIMYGNRGRNFDSTAIVWKLNTADVPIAKGKNARVTGFLPKLESTWDIDLPIRYHLDGRLSAPTGSNPVMTMDMQGEYKGLGAIRISNQRQHRDRVQPQIDYARGETIALEINTSLKDMAFSLVDMGIEFIVKHSKKSKVIGA